MKKIIDIFRWLGVTFFAIMALGCFASGGIVGGILLIISGFIIAPLDFVNQIRRKIKLNKIISIILAVVLFFVAIIISPSTETPTSDIDTQISQSQNDSQNQDGITDTKTESSDQNVSTPDEPEKDSENTLVEVGAGKAEAISLSDIAQYDGTPFTVINNNIPNFGADELKTTGYESYSDLDSLGRTRTAIASVGRDTMPKADEERGSISHIKPSGWVQARYENVDGESLYNRCHLIGWQLSAENANEKNLLTGTRYLNVDGMLPFENMIADYIKETGNHVAYRVSPIYDGDNLVASGVQMEAYSVEDKGEGICFNVYCYNVQPGIKIDYVTGKSESATANPDTQTESQTGLTPAPIPTPDPEVQPTPTPIPTPTPTPTPTPEPTPEPDTNTTVTVYLPKSGEKYHSKPNCGRMKNGTPVDKSYAIQRGYGPCENCH